MLAGIHGVSRDRRLEQGDILFDFEIFLPPI